MAVACGPRRAAMLLAAVWGPGGPGPSPLSTPQQSKMEDHLDEAIHVLRSHAVGTAGDVHGLLPGHGPLASGFAGAVMPLGGRHAGLVSAGQGQAGGSVGARPALITPLVHRWAAATRRTASPAVAASCTTTWPSPTSPGRLTPTAVSPCYVPCAEVAAPQGGPHRGPASRCHSSLEPHSSSGKWGLRATRQPSRWPMGPGLSTRISS